MSEKVMRTETYFCIFCSGDKLFTNKKECELHLREHFINCKVEERHGIDLWIERHLKYQELLSKSMLESIKTIPDRSKTLYRGCPVCDIIMKIYDIREDPYPKGMTPHEIAIRDINIHYSGNNINHINPHLRYYPFECLKCEEESEKSRKRGDPEIKEVVKTAVKPMMRIHVKEKHFKDSTLNRDQLEEAIEKSIRALKVLELENITKKHQNNDKKIKPKKHKSIPGPLRETKCVSYPPTKRLRPIVPVFNILLKSSVETDLKTNKAKYYKLTNTITPTQMSESETSVTYKIPEKLNIDSQKSSDKIEIVTEVKEMLSTSEELSEPEDESMKDKIKVFGCIFCHKRFKDYDKAFDHYLLHLNVFIECAKCDFKFNTIAKFRSHNSAHNENCNLLNVNTFKVVRKWIERFFKYLTKEKEDLIGMTRDLNQVFCPVCRMMSNVYDMNGKSGLIKDETIESHIHQHLNYFPYECIDCNLEDIKTEFCWDSNAKNHLIDKHHVKNTNNLDKKELSTYFDNKASSISKFDDMIEECVDITNLMRTFWENNSKDEPLNSHKS